ICKPTTATLNFTNVMRVDGNNTQFYKTAKTESVEKSRLWMTLSNTEGAYKQVLLGYAQGATNDIDVNYDAATMGSNSYVDFYTINGTKKLTIQGRALPFDNTEVIPLGYKSAIAGDMTIAIDQADGFFDTQEVYLEDKTAGTVTDLRAGNYTFNTAIGTFTDRFTLKYTNKTLGNEEFENLENSVLVSVKNQVVKITSSQETIKEVNVYNIGAQLLYSKNKVNASELQITNLHSTDQVILVKVTLENGYTFTKKAIFSNLK
ncbi:T9SS sorting signal type C domain-containing protein, partial [Flavobacterium ginsenosidimutans]